MLARNLVRLRLKSRPIFERTVVVPASGSGSRRRRKTVKSVRENVSVEDLRLDRPLELSNPRELERKLRQLREFTKNLQEQVRMADDLSQKEEAEKALVKAGGEEVSNEETAALILGHNNDAKSVASRNKGQVGRLAENSDLSSFLLSTSGQAKKLLPDAILERINDDELVLRSLINRRNSDWNAIVSKLYDSPEQLQGISHRALKVGLLSRVSHLSLKNIRKLESMFRNYGQQTGTGLTTAMYECLFANLSNLKPVDVSEKNEVFGLFDSLLKTFDDTRTSTLDGQERIDKNIPDTLKKADMNQFLLNCCIKFASKVMDPSKLNYYLTKFGQEYKVLPNRENYTTIIQFYSKMNLDIQAWDIFATMKFLSAEHKPDTRTYTTMLQLCAKEKNYAKAIDLFNEMTDLKVEISPETLNGIAKVLAVASGDPVSSEGKAEALRLLGWKYLHQNEDLVQMKGRILEDTIMTMMALCAYDGDVGLARALYFKYITAKFADNYSKWRAKKGNSIPTDYKAIWSRSLNPQIFNYLLLAYANFSPEKRPLLMGFDQGSITRRNLINSVDYQQKFDNIGCELPIKIPMLPVADFSQSLQVILESRALWQFNLEFGGIVNLREAPQGFSVQVRDLLESSKSLEEFALTIFNQFVSKESELVNHNVLNIKTLVSFLTIPIKMSDKTEFLLRLSEFSFEQRDLNMHISTLFNEAQSNSLEAEKVPDSQNKTLGLHLTSQAGASLLFLSSMKHKLLRESVLYELTMRAAIKFKDATLAKDTWESRGAFRKLNAFQKLEAQDRVSKDTAFASLMVDFFTRQEMYSDAMSIIMSSQRYIDWTYTMTKQLHHKLIELEDENSIKILLQIVNKRSS
ncbi:LAFA_0D11144g1_1 [Lachancea sp. 'fantastica']|nr:LAFA_0D11144g1_1 [Lachancea sp. 'fantastica']